MDSSMGSMSSPRRSKAASEILKTFRQARESYLMTELSTAFSTILPLVTETLAEGQTNEEGEKINTPAPIASASRKDRIRVWSFYFALLNDIAELGPEQGKDAFGSKEWKSIIAKAQDGTIWNDVVNIGYGSVEGSVDAEVVAGLAKLLLAQSPMQITTQEHIESYLSASSNTNLDLTDRFSTQINLNSLSNGKPAHQNGTDTPRDLETKVQLIELYTIHVLPRNSEWDYAKDFITMSEILDEERRDAFLQTLQNLKDEEFGTKPLQQLEPMHEPEKVQDTPITDTHSSDSTSTIRESTPSAHHHQNNGSKDYGIEENKFSKTPEPSKNPSTPTPKPIRKPSSTAYPSRTSRQSPNNNNPRKPSPTQTSVFKRSVALLATLQHVAKNLSQHISQNPMALLRFVLFLAGLIAAFSRSDVKERVGAGWEKVKRTVGMGVKVSYI